MIIVENIETMHQFEGDSLDFLIDESTQIGEVFLDGNLHKSARYFWMVI
jgi:hypothetical protein